MADAFDLLTFIEVYEQMLQVLVTEEDFYDTVMRYAHRVRAQGCVYAEISCDPQAHESRGISLATLAHGLRRAQVDTLRDYRVRCAFILCFQRDRDPASALSLLEQAREYKDVFVGIGLDNPEHVGKKAALRLHFIVAHYVLLGFPNDFREVYQQAARYGFCLTSHCDVDCEASVENIQGCLDELQVTRIDHGVNVLESRSLVERSRTDKIGFTVCPTLMHAHEEETEDDRRRYHNRCAQAAKDMLDEGLLVTLASDDPGIMSSMFVGDVYVAVQKHFNYSKGIPFF